MEMQAKKLNLENPGCYYLSKIVIQMEWIGHYNEWMNEGCTFHLLRGHQKLVSLFQIFSRRKFNVTSLLLVIVSSISTHLDSCLSIPMHLKLNWQIDIKGVSYSSLTMAIKYLNTKQTSCYIFVVLVNQTPWAKRNTSHCYYSCQVLLYTFTWSLQL